MNEKQIEINKKNKSRGYSGWLKINKSKFYCRSKQEAIYLFWLVEKFHETKYELKQETETFYFNSLSYRPDVFLYENGKLVKIFEIKDSKPKPNEKYYIFGKEFEKKGIEFEILYNGNKIYKNNKWIKEKVDFWLKNYSSINTDMSGKNNPHYGCEHSDDTKMKIGEATKKRMEDDDYKTKWLREVIKNNTSDEFREKISIARKKYVEKTNPFITVKCKTCGKIFKTRKNTGRLTCKNSSCTFKYLYSIGEIKSQKNMTIDFKQNRYKLRILKELNKIPNLKFDDSFFDLVLLEKEKGNISKYLGISENSVKKYFNTLEELKEQYENLFN